jgi:hypothetical protein
MIDEVYNMEGHHSALRAQSFKKKISTKKKGKVTSREP